MFANVVVGVDGSRTGREAIALALALAQPGAKLALAHVYGAAHPPGRAPEGVLNAGAQAAAQLLLEREALTAGVDATLVAHCSSAVGVGLHTVTHRQGADLLVVGSHSGGLIGRVLLGEHTKAALNGATCAVAVAPHGYAARDGGFLRIAVGYDFSPESEIALAAARALAARDGAKVRAIDVISMRPWGYASVMPANWGEILEQDRAAAQERIAGLGDVEPVAVHGLAVEELAAAGDHADLLVVGSRGYGPLRRLVLGSTSTGLAGTARCALLVLTRSAD